jgi:hypothetical protein
MKLLQSTNQYIPDFSDENSDDTQYNLITTREKIFLRMGVANHSGWRIADSTIHLKTFYFYIELAF